MKRLGNFFKSLLKTTILIGCMSLFLTNSTPFQKTVYVFINNINRDTINNEISKNKNWYVKQYAIKLKRREYTVDTIIKYAEYYNMPINFCLAVGLQESKLIQNCPPNINPDGSFDSGIFQLNSRSYPNVIDKYGTLDANVKQGISHLANEYKKYHSFEISAMMYNCGNPKRLGTDVLDYLRNVLKYEKELDEWLNSIYRDKIGRDISSGKVSL